MLRSLKQYLRKKKLARFGVSIQQNSPTSEIGTMGGNWTCSLQCLNESSIVYSFGAGRNISFDLELGEKTGCSIHIFDPTPISINWVKQQNLPDRIKFHEYGVGEKDGEINFFVPRKKTSAHYSPVQRHTNVVVGEYSAPVFCMTSIMEKLGHEKVDMVKMDIEGGEYDVLPSLLEPSLGINQIILEFHHNYSTIPLSKTVDAFRQLNQSGFKCIHISERTYEMAFLR